MACNIILKGIQEECAPSMGGISAILLYDKEAGLGATNLQLHSQDKQLKGALDMSLMPAGWVSFKSDLEDIVDSDHTYLYVPALDSSNAATEQTIDLPNGINFATTTLSMVFNKYGNKAEEYNQLATLKESHGVKGFYRDNNGQWYLIGAFTNLYASAASISSGTGKGDGNTMNISLIDAGPYGPIPCLDTACAMLDEYTKIS